MLHANTSASNGNNMSMSLHNQTEEDYVPMLDVTWLRLNQYYVIYYINWARNIVTGILPIASLIIFNQLVYRNLVRRRNLWMQGKSLETNIAGLYL